VFSPSSWNFLGLGSSETSFREARFIVVPVPYDSTASYRSGGRDGPRRVIEASRYLELFDTELEQEPYTKGVFTVEEVEPVRGSAAETVDSIRSITGSILQKGKMPVLIGGEHTITLGAVRALPEDTVVVNLDAHADLRDTYLGDSICHACVMRRILEEGREVVEVGVRSMSKEEFQYAREEGVPIFTREAVREIGPVLKRIRSLVEGRRVYLSIDIDVFDPSEAPGVSTPEPDGLSFREVKEIIRDVCRSSEVVGFDLVEVTPIPGNTITEFLAAAVIYKVMGYVR